jgi:secreted PhoX family phosphatase
MTTIRSTASRRKFLKTSGMVTLGFMGLYHLIINSSTAGSFTDGPSAAGYGPLLPDPNGILNLPKGFSYTVISTRGEKMSDGLNLPGNPDGMGSFRGANGKTIVVRNHEINPDKFSDGAFGLKNELLSAVNPGKVYDFGKGKFPGLGGTTTFIYDPASRKIEKQFLSLAGTIRNCAGGPTPWNTWITCEETTVKAGALGGKLEKDHGYVFEVPATDQAGLCEPLPIKAMGRFNHEAVAVDPRTSIVYLTEDMGDGGFYRYIPHVPTELLKGGRLQALAIRGQKSYDTRNWKSLLTSEFPIGKPFEVEWIDLTSVESPEDDLRYQGFDKGAARFARGEGTWFGNQELYFACTNGGKRSNGQVFRYKPSPSEGTHQETNEPGTLELFIESDNKDLLKSCDNLTVAPWGDIILCEDDSHPFLVGVTPQGEFYKLAENTGFKSEFSGGVFSPTGETYFVNIQGPGLTLAVTGPWKKL